MLQFVEQKPVWGTMQLKDVGTVVLVEEDYYRTLEKEKEELLAEKEHLLKLVEGARIGKRIANQLLERADPLLAGYDLLKKELARRMAFLQEEILMEQAHDNESTYVEGLTNELAIYNSVRRCLEEGEPL